jgi:tetratricopeptide (TPR) repeat protein
VRSADALTRARHLGNTARCLAMLERDMDQAHAMYAEARELADQAGTCLVSVEWAAAILFDFAGDYSQAAQRFERVLELARAEEDRWVEYEALRALVQLELESGVPAAATRYSSELVAVAAKMGEGSEEPTARALEALLRFRAGVAGAPALEQALARLRDVDAKGMLSYALTLAADGDLGAQRIAEAERRAAEALQAASAVSRRSQMALARVVLARAALVSGDRKRASSELDATRADFDQPLALNARARAAVTLTRSLLG